MAASSLVAQEGADAGITTSPEELLAGREWTPITEVDKVLSDDTRLQIQGLLDAAREKHSLHFILVTVRDEELRGYLPVAIALLQQNLALAEGGVVVVSERPGRQIIAYSRMLETRFGRDTLAEVDARALESARVAVGNDERILSLMREVLAGTSAITTTLTPGSVSTAEKLFVNQQDTIQATPSAPGVEEPASVPATTVDPTVPATPVDASEDPVAAAAPPSPEAVSAVAPPPAVAAPAPDRVPDAVAEPTSASGGFLLPFLMGAGTLLLAAGALVFLQRTKEGRGRKSRRHAPATERPAPAPREHAPTWAPAKSIETEGEPSKESLPLPVVDSSARRGESSSENAESTSTLDAGKFLKPRSLERTRPKRGKADAPLSDEALAWVDNMDALVQAIRAKSSTEPFNASSELDGQTLQELQVHYRALFRLVPPQSRPALAESLALLLEEMRPDTRAPARGGAASLGAP